MEAARPRQRCLAVWLGCGALMWGLVQLLRADLATWVSADEASLADLLVASSALVLVTCAGWLWGVVTTVLLSALSSTGLRWAGAPVWLRRGIAVACGLAIVGVPLGAQADSAIGPPGAPGYASLEGMTVPDIPDTTPQLMPHPAPKRTHPGGPVPAPAGPGRAPAGTSVLVIPGDTLWSIAREHSPAPPMLSSIARGARSGGTTATSSGTTPT